MSEELTEREAIVNQVIRDVKYLSEVEDFSFVENLMEMGKRLREIDEDHLSYDMLETEIGYEDDWDDECFQNFIARVNESRTKNKISDEEYADLMEMVEEVRSELYEV